METKEIFNIKPEQLVELIKPKIGYKGRDYPEFSDDYYSEFVRVLSNYGEYDYKRIVLEINGAQVEFEFEEPVEDYDNPNDVFVVYPFKATTKGAIARGGLLFYGTYCSWDGTNFSGCMFAELKTVTKEVWAETNKIEVKLLG